MSAAKKVYRRILGFIFKIPSFVIAKLPVRIRMALGAVLGLLWFDVFRIRRKVAIENVTIAFPDLPQSERVRIARASLIHLGRTIVEYSLFPFFRDQDLARWFTFEGEEYVESALRAGHGAILLTLHLGNGDFATAALSRRGWPTHLISKEFKAQWLNDLWFGMRRKHGTTFISPEKSSFEILRALRRGELVIFVLDQFMGPPIGCRTLFFGRETGTAMGCALMADRTKAPVLPVYTFRKPDGTHHIVFEKPLGFAFSEVKPDDGPREKNIPAMTQAYTDKIEEIVRRHPEQWMWIHRRWKDFRD
jgi:KDO2-lipid IV(A) lauroyltransferase